MLVPAGYEGAVLIGYQVPDGAIAQMENNAWIYRIQLDGALMLQNDPPRNIVQISLWYEKGDRTLISIPHAPCWGSDELIGAVIFCTGGTTNINKAKPLRHNISFAISYFNGDRITGGESYDNLLEKYFDRLVLESSE